MLFKRRFWLITFLFLSLCLLSPQSATAQSTPAIILLEPRNGSVAISPININAQISPGADRLVRITLIDQHNNLLSRKLLRIPLTKDNPLQFQTDLSFEIPRDSTLALLTFAIQDEYHRPQSLRSAVLKLNSADGAALQPSTSENNWLTIAQPAPNEVISGGAFRVAGKITPLNDNPVVFELMTEGGSIVGTSQLSVPILGETFEFEINLSYDFIHQERDVRLTVRQRSDTFAADAILDSISVILSP